jgi:hypothetical protein
MDKRSPHRWSPCRRCNDSFPEGTMFLAATTAPLRWKRGLLCSRCRELVFYDADQAEMNQGLADEMSEREALGGSNGDNAQ